MTPLKSEAPAKRDVRELLEEGITLDVRRPLCGSLVARARWWIEQGAGDAVVRHAVLTGGPSGGTP
jgi:hypothetical protein